MQKKIVIKEDLKYSDRRENIPQQVDAFLRILARWTIEELYFKFSSQNKNTRPEEINQKIG